MNRRRTMSPIGIEVSSGSIRAAQLTHARDGWKLHASVTLPRLTPAVSAAAPSTDEAERLVGVLERRGFAGTDAVLAAPPEMLLSSVLELPPPSSGAPVEMLAASELARIHRRDATALEMVMWEIPAANRAATGREYMVTACPHDAAGAFLDPFEHVGLNIQALDLRQLALVRACTPSLRTAPSMDAILHMGWDHCVLLIITDGIISYERNLEGAEGRTLVKLASERMGIEARSAEDLLTSVASPDGEAAQLQAEMRDTVTAHVTALCNQLNVSFSYISRRYTDRDLSGVMFTGEFASIPGLAPRVAELGVDPLTVSLPEPAGNKGHGATASDRSPGLLAAIGLAMHGEKDAA